MKILVVDNGTSYIEALTLLLKEHDVEVFKKEKFRLAISRHFDSIILTGGSFPPVVGHEDAYAEELRLIRGLSKPVLGICLGFELIARAFDATMHRMEAKEKGLLRINILSDTPLFLGHKEFEVYESHRWVVDEVQSPLIALAKSKDGIEAVRHESKLIFGFQFHPEMFPNTTAGDEIMQNVLSYIKDDLRQHKTAVRTTSTM